MSGDPLRALAANTDPQFYLHPTTPQHAVEHQGSSQAVPAAAHGEDVVDGAGEAVNVDHPHATPPPWRGSPPSEKGVRRQ